ncbi:MAG TPA: transglycosylase SLT domain-containing protein [Bacteroidia bacterium]|nr:transglycosylase SLT domain-containing protein [Bacteroidia bacterium]
MTARDFIQTALQAGFTMAHMPMVLSIGMWESKLNPQAVGDVNLINDTWGPSIGLMQIRTIKTPNANEHFRSTARIEALKNPFENLKAAYIISKGGTTWQPWTAYSAGHYKTTYSTALQAVAQYAPTPTGIATAVMVGVILSTII